MLPWQNFRISPSYLEDVVINVAGFIPFGFFFAPLLLNTARVDRRRAYVLTLILGGAISLAIELLQVYLPTRSSDLGDWLYNIIGTGLGIAVFSICRPFLTSKRWFWPAGEKRE